jgi:precorrin-2 methylase
MKQEHKDLLLYALSLIVLVLFLQTYGIKSSITDHDHVIIQKVDDLEYRITERLAAERRYKDSLVRNVERIATERYLKADSLNK